MQFHHHGKQTIIVAIFLCCFLLFSWGCDHEKDTKKAYLSIASSHHTNFKISEAGLFVDINNPYLGATPDGMVYCDSCGGGILEVKY